MGRHEKRICIYDNPETECREVFEDGVMVLSMPADQVEHVDRRGTGARPHYLGPWKPGRLIGDERARRADVPPDPAPDQQQLDL